MPNLGIYFNDEEVNYIKSQPNGFVRKCVQHEMQGLSTPRVIVSPIFENDEGSSNGRTTGFDLVNAGSSPAPSAKRDYQKKLEKKKKKEDEKNKLPQSGNTCKKCGFVLAAGKCVNKYCGR